MLFQNIKHNKLSKQIKSTIFLNVTRLSTGTAVASIVPILLQPILRSIYSPESFGVFSVYLSVVGIMVVVSSFKYEVAISLPDNPDDARALFHLSVLLAVFFNIFIFIIIYIFRFQISNLWNLPDKYRFCIFLIPVSALLFSCFNSFLYFMIRNKKFLQIGISKIARRSFEGFGQIFITAGRTAGVGLFLGDIIGQSAYFFSGLLFSIKSGLKINKPERNRIINMAKRYRQFAIYNTLPTLLNTLSIALPVFLVNIKYGESNTGFLDLTRLILFIPIVFISEPLSQVLLQRFNEYKNNNKSILIDFRRILAIVILSGILGIIIVLLFIKPLILLIFGDTWITSAAFAKILIIGIFFKFISEPFKLIFAAFEKIKVISAWQIIYFSAILSMFFIRGPGIEQFLRIFVMLESACYFLLLILVIIQISKYENLLMKQNN